MKLTGTLRVTIPVMAVLAGLTLAGCGTVSSAFSRSNVKLSGDEEVPPVNTRASGSGMITVKNDLTVTGAVKTSGVAATMAHIHMAPRGRNGPVIITLVQGKEKNTWLVPEGTKLSEGQYNAYRSGSLYVNVHSDANRGGEIRGQIAP